MDLNLRDKVAFVSGGSRGIGLAIATAFVTEGSKVAITARGSESLREAHAHLAGIAGKDRVFAIRADMTSEDDVRRSVDAAEVELGELSAVVANVGSGTGPAGYELDRAAWMSMLDVNLLSSVQLAGLVLPRLAKRHRGSFTLISSIAGLEALKAPIPYSVAKAGVLAAMKSYAREMGPSGVRVNAVAPGNVLFDGGSWSRKLDAPERREFFENYVRQEVALQRFGRPEEIADMVVFLASDRASFVSGSTVVVDGCQTRSVF